MPLCPDLVSGIVRDAMSTGGWRQRLIREAALAPARHVIEEEQPCVVYKASDLHFMFAFTKEAAAYAWKSKLTPRKRSRSGDYAITMRVTGRAVADVTIGEYVQPGDYDPKDTDSLDASWANFCSTARSVGRVQCGERSTLVSTGDDEVFQYQCFSGFHTGLRRAHLIDKTIAEANKLDGVNNQLGLPCSVQALFARCVDNRNCLPQVIVCLAQTDPMEPLPSDYGMQGPWDQSALLRAAKAATPPEVDPATVPAKPGCNQWVCGTGASEHVRHRVFLDVWFRQPTALWEYRSVRHTVLGHVVNVRA